MSYSGEKVREIKNPEKVYEAKYLGAPYTKKVTGELFVLTYGTETATGTPFAIVWDPSTSAVRRIWHWEAA